MNERVHDCVVVGAGPAGSAAALQMARDGLDVVMLERGTQPGEGMLSLFVGTVTGPTGKRGIYDTELYANLDSLSLTTEARLDMLQKIGVPPYDVMAAREHHPYIARLIQGSTLRE